MKRMNWAAVMLILAMALGVSAREGETFNVGGDPVLELSNVSGDVNIVSGGDGRIEINYTIKDDRIEVHMEQDGDTVSVEVEYPDNTRNIKGGVEFEVVFPAEGTVTLKTVSGDVTSEGISGSVELQTVSGNVSVADGSGRFELKSVSGNVTMDGIGAADVDASTMSGNVIYKNGDLLDGPYRFNTTSGKIKISHGPNASYRVKGNTVSGSIKTNLSDLTVKKQKYGPNTSVRGEVGGGDTTLDLSVVSGGITIEVN